MLIIFDLDGTLFQAKPVVLTAARRLLEERGAELPPENEILRRAGKGAGVLLGNILAEDGESARVRYDEILLETVLKSGELYDGVREAVSRMANDGHELIVCSNSGAEYIGAVLARTGLSEYIGGYYSAEGYPSKSELIAKLIVPNKAAVVIGDTHGDIESAAANGLPSIAALYGYGNKSMLAGATLTVNSPYELAESVRKIAQE